MRAARPSQSAPAQPAQSAPPALATVAAFVLDPAAVLEPQQRQALFDGDALLARLMAADRRVAAVACREWLQQLQLDPDFKPDLGDARLQIAMAPPQVLQQLARQIGLRLAAADLRKVIRREHRERLNTWMTADDWKRVASPGKSSPAPTHLPLHPPPHLLEEEALEALELPLIAMGQAWLVRFAQGLETQLGQRMWIRLSALPSAQHPSAVSLSPAQERALDALAPEVITALVLEVAELAEATEATEATETTEVDA